jgi:hypothetical protein
MTHKRIRERAELVDLARKFGVRPDWHEPDNQDVTATVKGSLFDNCGTWGPEYDGPEKVSYREMSVVLSQEGKPVAEVNLATLFAWATGHEGE